MCHQQWLSISKIFKIKLVKVKFRYSKKASKLWKNIPIFLTLLGFVKYIGRFFFSNVEATDYERPIQPFIHKNPKVLGLGRHFGQINYAAFGVFSADLSAPILVLWVPCPCFPLISHYFYKKLSLYIQIPNIYLELGFKFEFGLQRIRDLAIVRP